MSDARDDQPIDEAIQETVDGVEDDTTRREAVELDLQDRGRSDEGGSVEVRDVVPTDSPASGVVDPEQSDPPEPAEPG